MYAVIETGGKQYRVKAGDLLVVDKLGGDVGAKVAFDRVLMLGDGATVSVGAPTVAGAVVDVVGGRLYSAATGLGAHVTDAEGTRPLRCSAVQDLSLALVGTGFAYSTRRRTVQAELVSKILPVVRDVRRIGSAALDLCMVAAGRLDAYYEHGLHVWDSAAGALIAAEAGARVLLPEPGDPERNAALVVAAAPGITDQLLAVLAQFDGLAPIPG